MSATPVSSRGDSFAPGSGGSPLATSLRALLEQRRTESGFLSLDEAITIVVPLCLDLKERHSRGERLYVHPSSIGRGHDGLACLVPRLSLVPIQPRDRACIAPELQSTLEPGNQRASVFSVGAVLYEMLTGYSIGPAMRRPREVNPALPETIELLLSKALVSDPQHRPDDLGALASALHHLAPMKSMHPPEVDPSALDRTDEYAVDVRMSLLPPHEIINVTIPPVNVSDVMHAMPALPPMSRMGGMAPIPGIPSSQQSPPSGLGQMSPMSSRDPAVRLIQLKARLESDPRPRYTVHKDRMDHGPFSAVELLQQVASHKFRSEDGLRDELSGQDRPIKDWEEFSPFAEQAGLQRQLAAEKKEVSKAIQDEKKSGVAKALLSGGVVVALLVGVSIWFFEVRGSRNDDIDIADDPTALDISIDGGAKIVMKRGASASAGGKAPSGYAPSGQSYSAALSSNNEQVTIGQKGGADLTDGQLAGPLRNAAFINACGAPDSMHVTIQVAVKNGRAVGVSVSTDPPNGGVASCVDRSVRNLSWASSPHMDSFTTRF